MAILINNEANENRKFSVDIEQMGVRYKTDNDLYSFPSPVLKVIVDNLFYLLKNSTTVQFQNKWKYRPDYLSVEYYGTAVLWGLLLYVNQVPSLEDFDLDNVIIPDLNTIMTIIRDNIPVQEPEDLVSIDW